MMYDPTTETYHLQYQFHPNHINWGNISWGYVGITNLGYIALMHADTPPLRTS
jgi:hypothetical protein